MTTKAGVKRQAEEDGEDSERAMRAVEKWVCQIKAEVVESMRQEEDETEAVWKKGGNSAERPLVLHTVEDEEAVELKPEEVAKARKEEVDFMKERKIWSEAPVEECWAKTGKDPVSVR